MRFRLHTIFYLITLLAAAMGTWGPSGIWVGIGIGGFWAVVFGFKTRKRGFAVASLLLLGLACSGLLLPAQSVWRESGRHRVCEHQLRTIGEALRSYHQDFGTLPPAYLPDKHGAPMHSWRVLLLPYLGWEAEDLHKKYDFTEPWNGPKNSKLFLMHNVFLCPSTYCDNTITNYMLPVDAQTAWPGATSTTYDQVRDGGYNPILVIEARGEGIHWMEPHDLTMQEAVDVLTQENVSGCFAGHSLEDFFYHDDVVFHILLADGTVHDVSPGNDSSIMSAQLSINKSEDVPNFRAGIRRPRRVRWARICSLGVLIVLALVPFWVSSRSS